MYAPTGALQSAAYGKTSTFAGITETRGYNNSLQLNGMSAASSAGTAINIAPSYNSNNGEISSITNLGGHSKPANENEARDVDFGVRHVAFVDMSNVLNEAQK